MKIIFDTDPGIDDAMALHFASLRDEFEIIGITTVFGNHEIDITTRNALYLKEKLDIKAEVYKGAGKAILKECTPPPTFIHGEDGLGDKVDLSTNLEVSNLRAAEFIVKTVMENPNEITIVPVGPLTNIALAYMLEPQISKYTKKLCLMGGAFGRNGHYGNTSPVSEANIMKDPHAAEIVYNAGFDIVSVGLDVTDEALLEKKDFEHFKNSLVPGTKLIHDISGIYFDFYENEVGVSGIAVHDMQAFMYLLRPELYKTEIGNVSVSLSGPHIGQTVLYKDRFSFDEKRFVTVCTDVDSKAVIKEYLDTVL